MRKAVVVPIIAVMVAACTISAAYAYVASYDDSFEGQDIPKHLVVELLDNSSWSGSTWDSSIELVTINCSHSMYISVGITGLTALADNSIVSVYVDSAVGSAKVSGGTVSVSGFEYDDEDGDGRFTVRAVLPGETPWPDTARMTVTVVAGTS